MQFHSQSSPFREQLYWHIYYWAWIGLYKSHMKAQLKPIYTFTNLSLHTQAHFKPIFMHFHSQSSPYRAQLKWHIYYWAWIGLYKSHMKAQLKPIHTFTNLSLHTQAHFKPIIMHFHSQSSPYRAQLYWHIYYWAWIGLHKHTRRPN